GTWIRAGAVVAASTTTTSGSPVVIGTATAHRLVDGNTVTVAGVGGGANGTFTVKVIDATHFTLVNSTGTGGATTDGTWQITSTSVRAGAVDAASTTTTSGSPVVIATTTAHHLLDGTSVTISNVGGGANGTFVIKVIDSTHFTLLNSTGTGVAAAPGTWQVASS